MTARRRSIFTRIVNAIGVGGGDGAAGSAYASRAVTSTSNTGTGKLNPFDTNDHSALTTDPTVAEVGITYDAADGSFAPDESGIFLVEATWALVTDAVTAVTKLSLEIGAAEVWTADQQVHTAVDPVLASIALLLPFDADEKIQMFFDNAGTDNINSVPGVAMVLTKIAELP